MTTDPFTRKTSLEFHRRALERAWEKDIPEPQIQPDEWEVTPSPKSSNTLFDVRLNQRKNKIVCVIMRLLRTSSVSLRYLMIGSLLMMTLSFTNNLTDPSEGLQGPTNTEQVR